MSIQSQKASTAGYFREPYIFVQARTEFAFGINVADPREIGGWDLLRLLTLDHREQLLATDTERRKRIALPLPQILQLDEWHHPDIMNDEKPSDTECFGMLAEVLATGDSSHYKPTEPPNTDWRNWPRGGML